MRGFGWFVLIVLVSVVSSAATVLGMERLKLLSQPTHEPPARLGVPSLKGLSEDDARQNLKALGLVCLVSERKPVSGAAPGTVVEQSPAAGQQLAAHGSVSVVLARELPKVPGVVNRTLSEATALLAQAGYKLEQAEPIADPQIPKGSIASQLPAAEVAQETDKPVFVRVSAGPVEIEVPKLLGRGLDKAKAQAKDLGFELKISWTEQAETDNFVVLAQNPAAGKKIKPGEAVTVMVNH
ncbi:MAG TPA: PASTA domain-containing protein [Polyangiaceae bacterium]|nr:PASTA domain-containing protein [Polyangiaceae bacterium]